MKLLTTTLAVALMFGAVPLARGQGDSTGDQVDLKELVKQIRRNMVAVEQEIDRVEAEALLIALDLEGIAVSTGSACSSGTLEPSYVLRAMGLPHRRVQSSIRFSLGNGNTLAEVDRVIASLPPIVKRLRGLTQASTRRRGRDDHSATQPASSGVDR